MKPITLSKAEARQIIIHAAGLAKQAQFGKGKEAAYKVINHLGFIQVDTTYVVERAHHHALAARVPGYKNEWLEELQADARIYEFWTRDSGFMPMDEYRFSLPIHDTYRDKYRAIPNAERNLMNQILDRIAREGPLKAKDFENDRTTKSSGWWDWRPSKVALERLHFSGQLLATRKKDFHKLYDLTDNVVPAAIDRTQPTPEALARHLIFRSLKALGIAYANEIAWSGRLVKPPVKEELKRLVNEGDVCLVHVDGLKGPLYMLKKYANKKITLAGDVFILSPFDILNVFRRRLKDFFDFEYQVECFVPEPKRKFGYFSLPILAGDAFVARMDAKANRKEGVLTIHNLHFENVTLTQALTDKLVEAINAFAKFNTCTGIRITKCNNKGFMRLVNSNR